MSKRKEPEPEKIKGGELFDVRVLLTHHMVWNGSSGHVVTQYNDGSVMLKTERSIHTKAKPTEFEITLWNQLNKPK